MQTNLNILVQPLHYFNQSVLFQLQRDIKNKTLYPTNKLKTALKDLKEAHAKHNNKANKLENLYNTAQQLIIKTELLNR